MALVRMVADALSSSVAVLGVHIVSLGAILLIILVLMLIGVLPTWPHSVNWGTSRAKCPSFSSSSSFCWLWGESSPWQYAGTWWCARPRSPSPVRSAKPKAAIVPSVFLTIVRYDYVTYIQRYHQTCCPFGRRSSQRRPHRPELFRLCRYRAFRLQPVTPLLLLRPPQPTARQRRRPRRLSIVPKRAPSTSGSPICMPG